MKKNQAEQQAYQAERKAYQRAWSKAKYTERAEAGQCLCCGADTASAGTSETCCAPCREKRRKRQAKDKAERAAKNAAKQREAQDAPDAPVCGHCLSREVARRGRPKGIQRYLCRACGRFSQGFVPDPKPLYHCPYCRVGTCCKLGRSPNQTQMYRCRDCGRRDTGLWTRQTRNAEGPKCTHQKTFYLGPRASQGLLAYMLRTHVSVAQAIRAILRREAQNPTRRWAGAYRVSEEKVHVWSTMASGGDTRPINEWDIAARLPDLRPEWIARRMAEDNYLTYCPVAVVEAVTVSFDDTAKRGLLRVMQSRGLNHQEAMRFLLAAEIRAPVKSGPPPVKLRRPVRGQRAGKPEAGGEFFSTAPL